MVGSLTPSESIRLRIVSMAWIVDAGQLHQNLVLAEPVLLNGGFAHAQRVDTIADSLDGLGYGLIFQFAEHLRLHRQSPGVVRSGREVVLREALVRDLQQIFARIRRNALQDDTIRIVYRIRLGNVREGNLFLVELLFEDFDRIVGIYVDGVIDLHLEDQVGSAAQVQPKVNAVGHGREQALSRKTLRNAEDPDQEDDQGSDDECQFPEKILIHDEDKIQMSGYAAITWS